MPNDFITLKALSCELSSLLTGGKIDKIYMPEKDEINIQIRANGESRLLAISCNASNPRIHITITKKENPQTAPSFCMHLRKHIAGGIINSIQMLGEDRIVCIKIVSHNEMRDEVTYQLIAEMMGRYSNILLVNAGGMISDTLKQASFDAVTKRCLLPSVKYEIPEQSKLLPSNLSGITSALNLYDGAKSLADFLASSVAGLSSATATQIVAMSKATEAKAPLDATVISRILSSLNSMLNIFGSENFCPCISYENGLAKDYFAMKYLQYSNLEKADNLNEAIRECCAKKDAEDRQNEHTKFLQKALNSTILRNEKKLKKATEKYESTLDMEYVKKCGDAIMSGLHTLKKGQREVEMPDYSDENFALIRVRLNEQLTPQQNAQSYYKKYAKLKRTKDIVVVQIVEINDTLTYLNSIKTAMTICKTQLEINELALELEEVGAIKKVKFKKFKQKSAQPLTFILDEFVICVGKNNTQNDKLTFKLANGNDLWLHTKSYHGSHTLVFAEGRNIPLNVVQAAAELAAFYSQGKAAGKVEVDYTARKNVKRHPSGMPGMVTYSDFATASVAPCAHQELVDNDA